MAIYCPNCGQQNDDAATTCVHCGAGWAPGQQFGMPLQGQVMAPVSAVPENNPLAIASLACAVFGICCSVLSIAAVIMGHIARKQIRESNGRQTGDGFALAGMIIGYIWIGCAILYLIFVFGFAAFQGMHGH